MRNDDWRLTNQKKYLYRSVLIKTTYKQTGMNDHDHCEFCWEKFGTGEGMLQAGFCTIDRYRWICDKCYNDFKEMFQWRIMDGNRKHAEGF